MKKAFAIIIVIALAAGGFYGFVYPQFVIISGYTAKNMCSNVFVAGIDENRVLNEDLNFRPLNWATIKVDYENKRVESSVFGMQKKVAVYRNRVGCALINEMSEDQSYQFTGDWSEVKHDSLEHWFDYVDTIEVINDQKQRSIQKAVNDAFYEIDPAAPLKNTRAVVVIFKGRLVAEQYTEGFSKDSRLLGWSMTKSLTSTMIGRLVGDGKLDIDNKIPVNDWKNDGRGDNTWRSLLYMNSGLQWEEDYSKVTGAVTMLFNSDDAGKFAESVEFEKIPLEEWKYSSGTSNILAREIRTVFKSDADYIRYPYEAIFERIGMYSMFIETDASGYFIGSSFSYATARDWAKIGQLYLQNGFWAGEEIIPESWVKFVQQPAPNSGDHYGGHFWLNKGGKMKDVPADAYLMDGFHGQRVFIIPSKELVIVRLGLTYNSADFDFNAWVSNIINVLNE